MRRMSLAMSQIGAKGADVQMHGQDALFFRACTVYVAPLNARGRGGHIDMRMSLSRDRSVVL